MNISLGTLLGVTIVGIVALATMFLHPVGPILMLAFVTPFDGIFFKLFRFAGNSITLIPIAVFAMRTSPSQWGKALLGTQIQVVVVVWILLLLFSHLVAIPHVGALVFLQYARKLTYVLVLMLWVWYWRDARYVGLTIKIFVLSMTGLTLVSMLDFYGGIQLLPVSVATFEGGAMGVEFERYLTGQMRFSAPGLSSNRYGGYMIVFAFLAIGWFGSTKKPLEKAIAMGCAGTLVVGILCTVSRSAVLGLTLGTIIVTPMAFRVGVRQVIVGTVGFAALAGLVYIGTSYIGNVFETLEGRFEVSHVANSTSGRMLRWWTAVKIWATSPLVGVGDDLFIIHSRVLLANHPGGKGAHNAYVKLLAETGLVGWIPFLTILFLVTRSYLTSIAKFSPTHDYWRPYFFGGFIGISAQNMFNDYAYERIYWMTWAYAAVLTWVEARGRAELRAKHAQETAFGALGSSVAGTNLPPGHAAARPDVAHS